MLFKGKVLLKTMCGAGTHTSTYSDEFLGKKKNFFKCFAQHFIQIFHKHIPMLIFLIEYAIILYAK